VRSSIPSAAILLPAAFFFSVLSPHATAPNSFIYLAYAGPNEIITHGSANYRWQNQSLSRDH
jgi:hypothetical protein